MQQKKPKVMQQEVLRLLTEMVEEDCFVEDGCFVSSNKFSNNNIIQVTV